MPSGDCETYREPEDQEWFRKSISGHGPPTDIPAVFTDSKPEIPVPLIAIKMSVTFETQMYIEPAHPDGQQRCGHLCHLAEEVTNSTGLLRAAETKGTT